LKKKPLGKIRINLAEGSFSFEKTIVIFCAGEIALRYYGIRSNTEYRIEITHLIGTTGNVEKVGYGTFKARKEKINLPITYELKY